MMRKTIEYRKTPVNKGYTNRLLKIDLSKKEISVEDISDETRSMFVGGRGYCLKLVYDGTTVETKYDSPENVQATAKFVFEHLPSALGIELLPYHRLGESKYAALGISYSLKHIQTPSDEHMEELRQMVRDCGLKVISKNTDYAGNDFLTAESMGLPAKVFQGKF